MNKNITIDEKLENVLQDITFSIKDQDIKDYKIKCMYIDIKGDCSIFEIKLIVNGKEKHCDKYHINQDKIEAKNHILKLIEYYGLNLKKVEFIDI